MLNGLSKNNTRAVNQLVRVCVLHVVLLSWIRFRGLLSSSMTLFVCLVDCAQVVMHAHVPAQVCIRMVVVLWYFASANCFLNLCVALSFGGIIKNEQAIVIECLFARCSIVCNFLRWLGSAQLRLFVSGPWLASKVGSGVLLRGVSRHAGHQLELKADGLLAYLVKFDDGLFYYYGMCQTQAAKAFFLFA